MNSTRSDKRRRPIFDRTSIIVKCLYLYIIFPIFSYFCRLGALVFSPSFPTELECLGIEREDESLMKLVESNLDSDFVSEKKSDPIGIS